MFKGGGKGKEDSKTITCITTKSLSQLRTAMQKMIKTSTQSTTHLTSSSTTTTMAENHSKSCSQSAYPEPQSESGKNLQSALLERRKRKENDSKTNLAKDVTGDENCLQSISGEASYKHKKQKPTLKSTSRMSIRTTYATIFHVRPHHRN